MGWFSKEESSDDSSKPVGPLFGNLPGAKGADNTTVDPVEEPTGWSPKDLGIRFGVHPETVRSRIRENIIKATKDEGSGTYTIPEEEVERLAEEGFPFKDWRRKD